MPTNKFRDGQGLASAIAALLASAPLHAAALTWDNGAATGDWNTIDLNWSGPDAWNNLAPDDAVFGATVFGTVTLTRTHFRLPGAKRGRRPIRFCFRTAISVFQSAA